MKYEVWIKAKENDKSIAYGRPKAEIGKLAAEHGKASTVRNVGLKYPRLKRQTVSDFKLDYLKLKNKLKLLQICDLDEFLCLQP